MTIHNHPATGGVNETVVAAGAADVEILSQVIADSFHDLAPSRWLIADESARRQVFPAYFRILVEHALAAGTVYTTPGRRAAALWLPVSTDGPHQPGADYTTRLADATGQWLHRFVIFDAELDRHHPTGTAHDHLAILAVRPGAQGQGVGTTLLRAHHSALDETGTSSYLEASGSHSRSLYLRHGYVDHGPPIFLPEGPALLPMWRTTPRQNLTNRGGSPAVTGSEAGEPDLADVQAEFPQWRCTRGINSLYYAHYEATGQQVCGEDALDLRDQLKAAQARMSHGRGLGIVGAGPAQEAGERE